MPHPRCSRECAKLALVVFLQQGTTQGVIHEAKGAVSQHMIQWTERIPTGPIVSLPTSTTSRSQYANTMCYPVVLEATSKIAPD